MTTKVFFTPKEVAEELAPAIQEFTIIRKARAKEIECSRGSKNAILFTRRQIDLLIDSMKQPAAPKQIPAPAELVAVPERPNVFGATERSHRRSQRTG
ncbi:hypothetical protein FJV46_10540 [Arthrobacter agilis]|uniref:hypothetical protein n=1 Tax=Arthrobacter agilis TaxID=37921 RepID=UPI000B34EBAD|nr:hypothetical protein [Arthrobacter agilis]OUM44186.1 hypothetical protein B8W74_04740 [Arthrobacter agilis]PPB46561.1 hypothetical protein CI784_07035 [Arthrobacter agilis]TPV23782.1 hypothetical protein FJV46_10540 [Arthrobacter agilis]VDR32513.1 Uncharacterised protein [Arthrobacter agilis]